MLKGREKPCLNALESGRVIVTFFINPPEEDFGELSQCPGKRASHCYVGFKKPGRRSRTIKVSMPWKAGESLLQTNDITNTTLKKPVSMPWKAGESLLPKAGKQLLAIQNELSQCPGKRASHCYNPGDPSDDEEEFFVSMPWKAGESLLQTPFWRPVALRLVSPESLTPSHDPLRSQNKEFATPFSEVK